MVFFWPKFVHYALGGNLFNDAFQATSLGQTFTFVHASEQYPSVGHDDQHSDPLVRNLSCTFDSTCISVNPLFSHNADSYYSSVMASYSMTTWQCHRSVALLVTTQCLYWLISREETRFLQYCKVKTARTGTQE